MRQMHLAGKEWDDFKGKLDTGKAPAGIFLLQGPSERIALQVQSTLQNAALQGNTFRYFLCSGNEQFRVPCYMSFAESEIVAEPIDPGYLLHRSSSATTSLQELAVRKLEQSITDASSKPRFIVIEYMTPPGRHDLAFTTWLLHSPLSQHIPIVIFVHGRSDKSCPQDEAVDEMLSLLYLCGGRVHEADWLKMIDRPIEHGLDSTFVASRCIGSETWICYAHGAVAEMAEDTFRAMSREKRQNLAKIVLKSIKYNTGYPLLAIATETDEIEAMHSKYARKVVDEALLEPESVVRYFDRLHQIAQQTGADALAKAAYTGYIVAHLYLDQKNSLQIYQRYRDTCLGQIDQKAEAPFWYLLGSNLAVMNLPQAWTYAEDCLCLSRELANALYREERLQQHEWRFILASIANTEALLAYKLGQGERARHLEELAIAELRQVPMSLLFQVHVRVNFGDLFLRLLGDVKSALAQYENALRTSLRIHMSRKPKSQPELGEVSRDELRAGQKLGDALMLVGRHEEAMQAFEALLSLLGKVPTWRKEEIALVTLKARLSLAEAYLKVGRPRSAIACYWHILRQSAWLKPEALKEVAAKLRAHRLGLSDTLDKSINSIIATQEEVMADTITIQNILFNLGVDRQNK